MPLRRGVDFRDNRTGRFRSAAGWERNSFYTTDTLSKGIASFLFKTLDAMGETADSFAVELLEYAQNNAPWSDRTGDARVGLQSAVTLNNDNLEIDLFHTVEYGIWLEVRWGARYAIIIPTIETMGPRLFDRMQGLMSDITYYD